MKKIFITTTALLIACTLSAADLFVSPKGNDRNPGTKDSPKATLTAALRQARELRRLNDESVKGGITIHLEAGDYHLYEPVFIRPEDSGTEASPTVITSDGNAVLNGQPLNGVGVVGRPDLGREAEHSQVKPVAAGGAALQQDVRPGRENPAKHVVQAQDKIVGFRPQRHGGDGPGPC